MHANPLAIVTGAAAVAFVLLAALAWGGLPAGADSHLTHESRLPMISCDSCTGTDDSDTNDSDTHARAAGETPAPFARTI